MKIYIYLKRRLVLTVGNTFILDFKVLICSWAGVRKNIWSSDDDALRSVVTPGQSERKIKEIKRVKYKRKLFIPEFK